MSRVTLSCLVPTIYELRGLGVRLLEINDTLPRDLSPEEIQRLFLVVDNEELKEYLYKEA